MNNQLNGMTGVFLAAAELSKRGFIVTTTSRNAKGIDLLISNESGSVVYSIQVKTNTRTFAFWLTGDPGNLIASEHLYYILINIKKQEIDYYIVPSQIIKDNTITEKRPNSTFYSININAVERYKNGWEALIEENSKN